MMADPMADLGSSGAAPEEEQSSKEVFDPLLLQLNLSKIERIRAVMGIASGCIAGIAGLEGFEGLVCFLALHTFVSLMIWSWLMNFNLKAYTKKSWFKYMTMSIQQIGLSFMLFWTLFYGLVYLY